ncbi:EAL domain-containing response regulator [Pseudomonas chlororaphis]|uniref:EAL domain-containing response regulator n=1 Tax=Pseudomonas chlororaphis TaxID=587753 RepID=UPI0003D38145|nr:EAL domain-containing response regulator [Pseudomonas chlororaphis]AZD30816.1 diguanylate cyclase/phosphodiesterase [Pseudomonas chlororaphis]ETD34942.1 cyclic diguanylate phosphodiesterase [Pseudomonas chlororaphis subsp. aurantiaca PB-St2]QFS56165.1 EAL domain-containing protein [Pseudomonas chlororaphis subsp. aurantiaca]
MISLRILVLDKHSAQRSAVVTALRQLGVYDVVQASSGEQALALMQRQGRVDVALCDLAHKGMDCLDFLNCAGQLSMVRAVILYCDFQPQLQRAIGQMASFSGLELLGTLCMPIQAKALQKILQRYQRQCLVSTSTPSPAAALPNEDDIRRGLALGEFRAFFQPKFQLVNGQVAGVEVLARWQHPSKGLLLPKDFLAAVLAYDLIDEMFKRLLEQGLSLLGIFQRDGRALEMSFNLHASQLQETGLTDHICQALKRHGVAAANLTFELAENGLLEIQPQIQDSLLRLRVMGCGLSIDDFAVGFSSLKLLCQLPFTEIKLDGEFVRSIHEPRSKALIASTVALARALNMALVIEGVSKQRECHALINMGCELGQGFYYARPMSSHELLTWLQAPFIAGQEET